jgi:F0F1-type ATP synthase membrane subunit b/b'
MKDYKPMAKLTKTQAEQKVYELTEQLIKSKLDAKDIVASHKEKIKDIESEIKAVIEDFNTNNTP